MANNSQSLVFDKDSRTEAQMTITNANKSRFTIDFHNELCFPSSTEKDIEML